MRFGFDQSFKRSSIIDDLRLVISSKPVMVILALSTLLRIAFHFFFLPSSPSGFGPDEGTYAALAKYASQGLPMEEFLFFGAGLYNATKSITLPSALLVLFGMNELSATRSVASIYGLASSLVLALCFLALLRLRGKTLNSESLISDRKFLVLLSIFTYFPSNFVWSTIGLRESGSQFWLLTTFYLTLKLLDSTGRDSWKFTALCSLALTLAHGTRPQTALVFSLVALFTSIVLLFKFRQFFLLIAILIGVYAGQAYTTTPKVSAEESLGAFQIVEQELSQSATPKPVESNQSATPKPVESNQSATPKPVESNQSATPKPVESNQSATPKPVESNQSATPKPVESNQSVTPKPVESVEGKRNESASTKCTQANQIIQLDGKKFRCKTSKTYQVIERNPTETIASQIFTTRVLENSRNANALDAQSALPTSTCQNSTQEISRIIKCNLGELPYRLFAFLFRPLIFFDQSSTVLTLAALENLGWMILVPLSIWVTVRKQEKTIDKLINISLVSYVFTFASGAALYEGNLGTAFRHKSTILWPLIFILMAAPRFLPKLKKGTESVS